ncbi:hypothetical protein ADEAN_000454700 [Angomonas deanei]|uniref:Uncharacterized protein n=1 Tax=Angomonas deanei TaxID=59799 RepID=A0A7G2CC26_9TRYP|nr:hypothetical protein ADEAN_000454700 [Angomonas deanei]
MGCPISLEPPTQKEDHLTCDQLRRHIASYKNTLGPVPEALASPPAAHIAQNPPTPNVTNIPNETHQREAVGNTTAHNDPQEEHSFSSSYSTFTSTCSDLALSSEDEFSFVAPAKVPRVKRVRVKPRKEKNDSKTNVEKSTPANADGVSSSSKKKEEDLRHKVSVTTLLKETYNYEATKANQHDSILSSKMTRENVATKEAGPAVAVNESRGAEIEQNRKPVPLDEVEMSIICDVSPCKSVKDPEIKQNLVLKA